MSVLSGRRSWYAAVGMKRRDIDGLLHGWQEAIATCKNAGSATLSACVVAVTELFNQGS